ncbi:MAG: FAD-dependent oxidoreductase, partial [Chloroflexota bacterium]|nr:FAD-dependent oxidoreductase [Chloroflexota bacterium]
VFLAGERDPGTGPRIVLDGTRRLTVNELAPLSLAAPSYAPPGRFLLAAAFVGEALERDDDELVDRARADAALMLGQRKVDWSAIAVVRVPFAQFAQPPGIHGLLPSAVTGVPGLFLAGEALSDSSYNGALLGGEAAAHAVLSEGERP